MPRSYSVDNLAPYIKEVANTPFRWGEHDCLTFTNEAWRRMHGHGWSEDWLGRYLTEDGPMTRHQLQIEFGYRDFVDAVDARLTRIEGVPPRGALVATKRAQRWAIGHALGISVGLRGAFLSGDGIIYLPLESIDKAWIEP